MHWEAERMNGESLILRNQAHFYVQRALLNQKSGVSLESVQFIVALTASNPTAS